MRSRIPGSIDIKTGIRLVPVGSILAFAGAVAPKGWILCDGRALSRSAYSALFSALGVTYGVGDGSTTFNIPDLRGRATFGKDNMGGSSAGRVTSGASGITGTSLGASGGGEVVTLTTSQIPAHSHGIPTAYYPFLQAESNILCLTSGPGNTHSTSTSGGSGGSHLNMPPALILNFIIYSG